MNQKKIPASVFKKSDKSLPYYVIDAIEEFIFVHEEDKLNGVTKLGRELRAIYTTTYLAFQMRKAGFHCYFTNSRGKLDSFIEEDLTVIGAIPYLDTYRSAYLVYQKHDYQAQWDNIGKSWDIYEEGFKDRRFEEIEALYDKVSVPLDTFISRYIRANEKYIK